MNYLKVFPYMSKNQKCGENVYELKDHVGEKALSLNLPLKLGLLRRIPLANFPNRLLESV
jgi:hypothetical protein